MRSTDDYLALVPPLYANKPNFMSTIAATVSPFADLQTFLSNMPAAFDLDVAIGVQLDAVGQWAGISRNVAVPVLQSWFSLDYEGLGLDEAPWKITTALQSTFASLDDTTYRRLIRAKIIANYSDGTVATAQEALSEFFLSPTTVFVVDASTAVLAQVIPNWFRLDVDGSGLDQGVWFDITARPLASVDMIWQIGVIGTIPDVIGLEILAQRLIPISPMGVRLDIEVATIANTPLMGLDVENNYVSGLDVGCWGASPDYVAENIL